LPLSLDRDDHAHGIKCSVLIREQNRQRFGRSRAAIERQRRMPF
jgi:hypothetical protein